MTVLVLAVGNSSTRIAALRGQAVLAQLRFETHALPADAELETAIARLLREHAVDASVLCSVVPDAAARLAAIHDRVAGTPIVAVDTTRRLWFDSQYETMDTLGADRWCAVIAAREEYGYPSVVVDCGTALTINVIDAEGNFAGGNILPGIATSFRSLVRDTAQLPAIAGEGAPPLVGRNTLDAIRAGVMHTIARGVDAVIDGIAGAFGTPCRVVLTGGEAELLRGLLRREAVIDPDLVVKGAARWVSGG